jgi:fructose-specific phosphotransferase system IIC component
MSEVEYQVVKSVGFVAALLLAIGLQSARPHSGIPGSWRVNTVLWALNALILGIVCTGARVRFRVERPRGSLVFSIRSSLAPGWPSC